MYHLQQGPTKNPLSGSRVSQSPRDTLLSQDKSPHRRLLSLPPVATSAITATSATAATSRRSPVATSAIAATAATSATAATTTIPDNTLATLSHSFPYVEEYKRGNTVHNRRLYPQKLLAIYYINLTFENMKSFVKCFVPLSLIKCNYFEDFFSNQVVIMRVRQLSKKIEDDQFIYTSVNDRNVNITYAYNYIRFLTQQQYVKDVNTKALFFRYFRYIALAEEYNKEKAIKTLNEIVDPDKYTVSQKDLYNFNVRHGYIKKAMKILEVISFQSIEQKLQSQYEYMKEIIDIMNNIWLTIEDKAAFYKYVRTRSSQKGSGGRFLLNMLKKRVRSKNINEDEDAYIQLIYKYRYANYENFNNIYKYYENILEYFQFLYQEKDRKYRIALESMGNMKDAPLEKESNILDTLPEVLKVAENKLKYIDYIKSNIEEDLGEIYPLSLTN